MASSLRRLLVCTCLLCAIAATLVAQQGDSSASKILVLRNGRVLRGDLTRLGERSIVVLNNGGQIQLPSRDIAVEASTLIEAYELLRDRLDHPEKIDPHLELANWCIREGLYPQAAEQLLVALEIDAQDARIDRISRQLAYAAKPKSAPAPAPAKVPNPPPTNDFEKVVETMPKEAVAEFTSSMQMLLLNRCGTSRCHDSPSASEFRLLRPTHGDRLWRRITLRNLHATRSQIDDSDPDQSPLLLMASTPHGGLETPVFSQDAPQLAILAAWVRSASRSTATSGDARSRSAGLPEPGTLMPDVNARPLAGASSKQEPQANTDALPQNDPFDPAVFNELYLSDD